MYATVIARRESRFAVEGCIDTFEQNRFQNSTFLNAVKRKTDNVAV